MPSPELLDAQAVLKRHREALMKLPNVIGVASSVIAGEPAIVVFVTSKPSPGQLPTKLNGVRVHYQITDPPELLQDRTARIRPAVGGISVGHPNTTAGTISAVVSAAEKNFIMSNNHVIGNFLNPGARVNDPIVQPGAFDGGNTRDDTIAYLHSWEEVVVRPGENLIDVALAEADPRLIDRLIKGTRPWEREVCRRLFLTEPENDMIVFKSGRTTAITVSTICHTDLTVAVRGYRFTDQILVRHPFGRGGDSGSMVMTPEGRFIGLLWAGGAMGIVVCKASHIVNWVEHELRPMLLRPGAYGARPPELPPDEREIPWLTPIVGVGLVGGSVLAGMRKS